MIHEFISILDIFSFRISSQNKGSSNTLNHEHSSQSLDQTVNLTFYANLRFDC